ncbi:MAG: polysaccharide biosynthesis tyrosine autokinase [Verrucomicrobiota bacterium]
MNDQSGEIRLHALDYWQVIRNRYGVILLAFFLVFMTAGVITYILPRQYLGRVVMEIKRNNTEWNVFGQNQMGPGWEPIGTNFVQTQFEIITSKETLYRVIDELDLTKRWKASTKNQTYGMLRGKIRPEPIRGTDLMEIYVYDTDRQLAAALANSVAENYKKRREEQERDRANQALLALDQERTKQEERVEEARLSMLDIMKRLDIIDINPSQGWFRDGVPMDGSEDVVRQGEMTIAQYEQEIARIQTQIETLTDIDGEQLIELASSLGIEDGSLARNWPRYQELILEEGRLRESGLGRNHPEVKMIRGQIEQTQRFLQQNVDAIKRSLGTQLEFQQKGLAEMQMVHDGNRGKSLENSIKNVEYQEAKKHYDIQNEQLRQMQTQLSAESVDILMPKLPIVIHEKAEPASSPAKPNVGLTLALGAVVGFGFGVMLAFFLEYLDTSVKSLEDVERYLQVPVLAVIPKDVGVLHKQNGLSPDAEAYRILRTNIEFNRKSADANSITVVSGGAGEGKSTTLVNLAFICAQGGYNTLMIDGDLRRPKLHTFFDINNSVGLTNYLTTELQLEDVILQTPVDNLYFMPSGILPADAAGILNSRRMSELIADVKSRFDLVLIDSPPILGVSDASVLASEVDLTMVVIQHRKLPRSMLMRVKQAIENVGGNLLGVVLNNVDVRSDSQYQYYTSYYTYYSPTNTATVSKPSSRGEKPAAAADPQPVSGGGEDEY